MGKQKPETTLGVLIGIDNHYGTDHICVRVMRRQPGESHPLGITFGMFEDHGDLADLILDGFIAERSHDFIGFEAFYDRPHQVKRQQATAMARVLGKIERTMQADHASDPGDVFTAFCKAIGAKWAAHRTNETQRSSLAENDWRWMTIPEGREYLRHVIAKAQTEAKASAA